MPLLRSRDGRLYNVPDEIAARFLIPPPLLGETFRRAGMQVPTPGMTPDQCLVEAYHWGHWVAATALATTLVQVPVWGGVAPSPACVCVAPEGHEIHAACHRGDRAAVESMLGMNPSLLHMRALDGRNPLHFAASCGSQELVELLLARGIPVDARDHFGITPLHVAAAKGCVEVAETLVRHGAQVNARHRYGKTPLATAIAMDSKPLITLLMQYGGTE
jgi:hypothetical protein